MDILIMQAPAKFTVDEIELIYNKNDKDIVKSLTELWEIAEQVEVINENTQKWNKIRDTCDSYDIEMQKIISRQK